MGASEEDDNRRTESRRGWWFPVEIEGVGLTAVCRDVSARGMQLAVSGALAEGTHVCLRFEPPGSGLTKTVTGRVVRSEPNDDDSRVLWPQTAGVLLDTPDDELGALGDPGDGT